MQVFYGDYFLTVPRTIFAKPKCCKYSLKIFEKNIYTKNLIILNCAVNRIKKIVRHESRGNMDRESGPISDIKNICCSQMLIDENTNSQQRF